MKTLLVLLALAGGASGFPEAVLFLSGATCMEELDAQVLERYETLRDRPLDLNSCPRSRLLSSGLFSAFQVASLVDYRARTGDVLSFDELSLVDGFSPEFVDALRHFVLVRSSLPPGTRNRRRLHDDLTVRETFRNGGFSTDVKNILTLGGSAELVLTASGTASLALFGTKFPGKLIAGDFNARFGQGLALWSGFTMSGFPSASSFRRNGNGFSPSRSFSAASHRGVAADVSIRRWTLSAGAAFPGLRGGSGRGAVAIFNATHTARTLTFGLTAAAVMPGIGGVLSADFRAGLPDVSLFGEAALSAGVGKKTAPAFVGGVMWVPSYGRKFTALCRFYSPDFDGSLSGAVRTSSKVSDEAGLALGWQSSFLSSTIDLCVHPAAGGRQIRSINVLSRELKAGSFKLKPALRAAMRLRPGESPALKTDLRAEVSASTGEWNASVRYNTIFFRGRSWLWYADAGYARCHLRFTIFKVDDWDDRIYVYEHDCAGCFTVPSYYGRGYSLSAFISKSFTAGRSRHELSLRARYTDYPWTRPAKPSMIELRAQYRLSL